MVSQVSGPSPPVSALVVDEDSRGRRRICKVLARRGFEVKACSSLAQGREFFNAQPIVLARSPGAGSEFNGFVDWVRERSGESQPYIVAIDDQVAEGDAMSSAAANPGCNAVMPTPVDDRVIEERLAAFDCWLESRHGSRESAPEKAAKVASPFQSAPNAEAVPREGQSVYTNILVENAPMAMAMFDREMRYLVANRKWKEEFHLEDVVLLGRSHFEVFPSLPESWRSLFDRCLSEGAIERCEEDLFGRPDGTTDWVRWEVRPWHRADGTIGGVILTSEVITERREQWKDREKALVEERNFFAAIPDNAQIGIILVDREGRALYCNPQHRVVLGFDVKEEEDIEAWLRRGCPEEADAEEVLEVWREKIWRKQIPEVFTLATAEGLLKEIRFDATLLEDGNLLLSFSDVTEARRLEESLCATEAKCRALFQGSRVGMALVDRCGDFFDVNAALESMLGRPRWEIRSKPLREFINPEDLAKLEVIDAASGEGDRNLGEVEVRFVRKNKELVSVRLTASPVRDPDGSLLFTAYTVCDLSAQRRTHREPGAGHEQNRALLEAIPDLV